MFSTLWVLLKNQMHFFGHFWNSCWFCIHTFGNSCLFVYGIVCSFSFLLWIKRGCIKIARCGIAIFSLLILLDYPSLVEETRENTVFFEHIFSQQPVEMSIFSVSKLESILSQLANDFWWKVYTLNFLLTGSLALFLSIIYKDRPAFCIVMALSVTFVIILLYCVADDNKLYYGRFIGRGLAPVWYLIILTIVLNGFYKGFLWVDRLISRNVVTGKQIFNLFFNGSAVSLLLYLIILTSNSFYANGYWNTKHFSRYIPTSLWETYIWVEKNIAPNAEVLALNWRDIYLLPIYTDVNLIYGSWIIDNRSALFEVERYLAGQNYWVSLNFVYSN